MANANYQSIIQELVRRSNEEARRLRSLEQRLDALESRTVRTEEGVIEKMKKANSKFMDFDVSLKNISDELVALKNSFERINKQINKFARKRDIKEIERMFDLLSPIRQEFVTRDDLKEEVEEAIQTKEFR